MYFCVNRDTFVSGWTERSKEQHLFEIKILCNIINVFTVTFDQFNESLLNKMKNLYKNADVNSVYIYIYLKK